MVLDGKSPVIFGDDEQSRGFTFVKDVVNANIQAAESNATGVFNIGNSNKVTINRLVQLIVEIVGNKSIKPIYKETCAGDIKHSLADISLARAFGYNPRYNLEAGLKEVYRFFKS